MWSQCGRPEAAEAELEAALAAGPPSADVAVDQVLTVTEP
jgi:hypothetical protein